MMRQLIFALTVLIGCGTVPAHAQAAGACAITVEFASYGAGIDRPAYDRVRRALMSGRGVLSIAERRWGREGEATFCVRVRRSADAARLFVQIRRTLPRAPRGPIVLSAQGGMRYAVPGQR